MTRKLSILGLGLILTASGMTGCSKDGPNDNEKGGRRTRVAITADNESLTRTSYQGDGTNHATHWCEDDVIGVYAYTDIHPDVAVNEEFSIAEGSREGGFARFEGELNKLPGTHDVTYHAYYPHSASNTLSGTTLAASIRTYQYPSASSYDCKADFLIGETINTQNAVIGEMEDGSPLGFMFRRPISITKFDFSNVPEEVAKAEEMIEDIMITATGGEIIAGAINVDMQDGSWMTDQTRNHSSTINLRYQYYHTLIDQGYSAWFTMLPATLRDMEIVITTTNYIVTKTVAASEDLEFKANSVNRATIDLSKTTTIQARDFFTPFTVGFEPGEDFGAASNFTNETERVLGPTGGKWNILHGSVIDTENQRISGLQVLQMRTNQENHTDHPAYAFNDFDLRGLNHITFKAKNNGQGGNILVQYSTDGGDNWIGDETFTLSSTVQNFAYILSPALDPGQKARIKFTPVPPTREERYTIDDVHYSNIDYVEPVIAITGVETADAENYEDTATGATATINGSFAGDNLEYALRFGFGFEYKKTTDAEYITVGVATDTEGAFSYELTGLITGEEYSFRAWASLEGGGTDNVYGEVKTFIPTKSSIAPDWTPIMSSSEVVAGTYIIVSSLGGDYYALPNTVSNSNPVGVSVTVVGYELNPASVSDGIKWTLDGDNAAGFTVSSSVPSVFNSSNAAQGLRVAASAGATWFFSDNDTYGLLMARKDTEIARYPALFSSGSAMQWRYYNTGNDYKSRLILFRYAGD